jgi:hypothetical protein
VRIFLSTVEGSKRWAKLAIEASAILLRAIGRPARVRARAACVDAAGCWAAELQLASSCGLFPDGLWVQILGPGGADTGKICIL